MSHNLYVYCNQNPISYIDLDGHEIIIVSGGAAKSDKFKFQFIETSLKDIHSEIAQDNKDEITWMIIKAGYTPNQIEKFNETAGTIGVNIVTLEDRKEFINYINTKNISGSGGERNGDLITKMSFFAHGQTPKFSGSEENQISFAYNSEGLSKEQIGKINFKQSDIVSLDPNAFNNAETVFYSCNAGTKDENGKSFAQEWSNLINGKVMGVVNTKTPYTNINQLPGVLNYINYLLNKKYKESKETRKKERNKNGYSDLGSLYYPSVSNSVFESEFWSKERGFGPIWSEFKPEKREKCEE